MKHLNVNPIERFNQSQPLLGQCTHMAAIHKSMQKSEGIDSINSSGYLISMFYRLVNRALCAYWGSAPGTPPTSTTSFKPRPFADLPGASSPSTFTQRATIAAAQGFDRVFPILESYLCLLYITGAFQSDRSAANDDNDEKQRITKNDQITSSTTGGIRIGHFKITTLQRLSFHSNGTGGLTLSMHESPQNGNQSTFFVPSFYSLRWEKQGSSSSPSSLFQHHYFEQFHSH